MNYKFPRFPIALSVIALTLSSCATNFYIVRHAEKAVPETGMGSDVPLTAKGEARALLLKERLSYAKIAAVYSTNTRRTRQTAKPTAESIGLESQLYIPLPDSLFYKKLLRENDNVLIVGHSNTVDDLVNGMMGKVVLQDLNDSVYNRLFIVRKKGNRRIFREEILELNSP